MRGLTMFNFGKSIKDFQMIGIFLESKEES